MTVEENFFGSEKERKNRAGREHRRHLRPFHRFGGRVYTRQEKKKNDIGVKKRSRNSCVQHGSEKGGGQKKPSVIKWEDGRGKRGGAIASRRRLSKRGSKSGERRCVSLESEEKGEAKNDRRDVGGNRPSIGEKGLRPDGRGDCEEEKEILKEKSQKKKKGEGSSVKKKPTKRERDHSRESWGGGRVR